MSEVLNASGVGQEELIDAPGKVVGAFDLILQAVPGNLAPHIRLIPVHPSAAHFVRIPFNI